MYIPQPLIIVICLAAAILTIHFFRKLKKTQEEILNEIRAVTSGKEIIMREKAAYYVGQKSRGLSQVRGNGYLALTNKEVFFAMTIPKTVLNIPLSSITGIEKPMRFLGKCILKPLLQINLKTEIGNDEAYAFYVRDLDQWVSEINLKRG